MTCYTPIEIFNPKKILNLDKPEQMILQVPCNQCQGCLDRQAREYSLRTYYEFYECVNAGGYAIFDCLTYREKDVPRLEYYLDNLDLGKHKKDYCFDFDDLRYFFVRLRRRLAYMGYPKDCFRQFYSSEYGTRRTKRPHYHIMLFVKKDIPPLLLSQLISDCWPYGRTDGIKFRGARYVLNHCVFKNTNTMEHVFNTTEYVTKYILKDLELQAKYHKTTMQLLYPIYKKEAYKNLTSEERKTYRYIKNLKANQHKHSHGFGKYLLDIIPESYIRKYCEVYFMHKYNETKIAVPAYYVRKLYQLRIKTKHYESWIWTDAGLQYKENLLKKNIQYTYDNYKTLKAIKIINNDPKTLTYYKIYEYGRIHQNKVSNLKDLLPTSLIHNELTTNKVYNYTIRKDYEKYGHRFVSNMYIDDNNQNLEASTVNQKDFVKDHSGSNLPNNIRDSINYEIIRLNELMAKKAKQKRATYLMKKNIKQKFKENAYNY